MLLNDFQRSVGRSRYAAELHDPIAAPIWKLTARTWSTVKLDRNGIRFFYEEVLGKTMPWLGMVRPPKVQALPDVLSIEELASLVAATRERRYRIFWLATYSMGLRLGETLALQVDDIDRRSP